MDVFRFYFEKYFLFLTLENVHNILKLMSRLVDRVTLSFLIIVQHLEREREKKKRSSLIRDVSLSQILLGQKR